jgi:ribosome biogenesis GTPase
LTNDGLIIAAFGRQYLVEFPDGTTRLCFPRGKKSELACGDRVAIMSTGEGQGVVEKTIERSSLLYRSNEFRQKLIGLPTARKSSR